VRRARSRNGCGPPPEVARRGDRGSGVALRRERVCPPSGPPRRPVAGAPGGRQAGDLIAVESPAYFRRAADPRGPRPAGVRGGAANPRCRLDFSRRSRDAAHQPVRVPSWSPPTVSDPLGAVIAVRTTRAVVRITKRYDVPIIADYGYDCDLVFDGSRARAAARVRGAERGQPPPVLVARCPQTLAPGYRFVVGWPALPLSGLRRNRASQVQAALSPCTTLPGCRSPSSSRAAPTIAPCAVCRARRRQLRALSRAYRDGVPLRHAGLGAARRFRAVGSKLRPLVPCMLHDQALRSPDRRGAGCRCSRALRVSTKTQSGISAGSAWSERIAPSGMRTLALAIAAKRRATWVRRATALNRWNDVPSGSRRF